MSKTVTCELKKNVHLEARIDLYEKVLKQIADQPRGSLSRRLARSVMDLVKYNQPKELTK
jgi:hypothetical protein